MRKNRSLKRHMGARRNHKQISVPVCSPEIFSRTTLSRLAAEGLLLPNPTLGTSAHLGPPASVDERADWLVRPRSTGVEVGAVPGLYQPHEVGTFTLQEEQQHKRISSHHRQLRLSCHNSKSQIFLKSRM